MMKWIDEMRFKLEILWIDHPHLIMFMIGFITGAVFI